jgi:BNR/Asp-box repeat
VMDAPTQPDLGLRLQPAVSSYRDEAVFTDVPDVRAMKAPLRSLGLVFMVLAATACGPRLSHSLQPHATATPLTIPSSCAQVAYGKPCSRPVLTPTASSLPTISVAEVAFSDSVHGWAVGSSCIDRTEICTVLVDKTANAGATWSPPIRLGQYPEEGSPGGGPATPLSIRFVGANMWVAGPGVYESHNGGLTWNRVFAAPVAALEPAGGTAWALADCTVADPSTSCVLFTSPIGSDVWRRSAVQPPIAGAGYGGPEWSPVLLERAPHGVAFVVRGSPQPGGKPWAAITRNDGASWQKSQLPCTFGIAGLRSPDGTTVWLLCGGSGGAGSGPKAVYVSFDGGTTWEERADNVSNPPVGSIPGSGYATSLAVTEGGVALISSARAGIIRSADGGHSWHDVGSNATCLLQGNGVDELWFLANGVGWALEENDDGGSHCPLLIRTSNAGLNWNSDSAPLGWSADQGQ